jgi:hypothetical protein
MPLNEVNETTDLYRQEYNESRSRRALGERTPNEFAQEMAARRDLLGSQTAEDSPQKWYEKAAPTDGAENSLRKWHNTPA